MNKMMDLNLVMFIIMMSMIMLISWVNLHPTHLIIMLMIYSIMISINLSLMKKTFIYSIMMFLIMVSGVLIIFLYFSSIISNEKVKLMKFSKLLPIMMMLVLSTLFMMKTIGQITDSINKCMEMDPLTSTQSSMYNSLEWIYYYPYNSMSILCMMFLLMTMFTIIKLTSTKSSPLRKIN